MMNRYTRQILLPEVGFEGQKKINAARVLVVGAGGLGCPVLQTLAGAGIGTLGIADFDKVELSNLHRQPLYTANDVGLNKVAVAKKRLLQNNPEIKISTHCKKITASNALQTLQAYDIIVDGTDNFTARYALNDACITLNKPLVYGAIYKFEGQVSVFNYKNGPSYRDLFPVPPDDGDVPNCSETGVLGVLPAIIGNMQATEVLKMVLQTGQVLSGRLFCYNALTNQTRSVYYSQTKGTTKSKSQHSNSLEKKKIDEKRAVPEITTDTMIKINQYQLIDVREPEEEPGVKHLGVTSIPLKKINQSLHLLKPNTTKIIFCQSGIRSKKAVSELQKQGISNCHSLKGGVFSLLEIQTVKSQ